MRTESIQKSLENKKPLFESSLLFSNSKLLFYPSFSKTLSVSVSYKEVSYLGDPTVITKAMSVECLKQRNPLV